MAQLRKVALWLSPPYPDAPDAARYHADDVWLGQPGRDMGMLKGIEFSNVLIWLTTLWQGEGMSLDILGDGKDGNVPVLARSAELTAAGGQRLLPVDGPVAWGRPVPGQHRRPSPLLVKTADVPEPNGIYRLTTQAQGDAQSLGILNDSKENNISVLSKTTCDDSAHLWKVTSEWPVKEAL
ncbi:hypothetical protein [Myxococcus faecalis]|uniref:hypothetical protein n=1 Tax=Myxococcus faecalis TaxID=3115646 RepID=UPI003CE723B4